jgi:hypothetical protein
MPFKFPNITQAQLDLLTSPGITFVQFAHDASCPGSHGDGDNCNCVPDVTIHRDREHFIQCETENREKRRAAAREAAKAMQRARK